MKPGQKDIFKLQTLNRTSLLFHEVLLTGRDPSTREAINCEGKHACQQVMYSRQRREQPFITLRWGNSHELWSDGICINEGTA